MNERERERERREEKPKQSTNIANNDFFIIILSRNFPTCPKIFPENEKNNTKIL
jgi:serine kinase of HPr protein (carbohydrate metabolism regulator)